MIRLACVFLLAASTAFAQAQVEPGRSYVRDGWWRLEVALGLTDYVPYRVYTLDEPMRLVLEFEGLSWEEVQPETLLEPGRATALRFGALQDDWSRLVIDLAGPLKVATAAMAKGEAGITLRLDLRRTSQAAFAAASDVAPAEKIPAEVGPPDERVFTVLVDPGHGGIDPGADRGGLKESDLMLALGQEVVAALADLPEVSPILSRDRDVFVSLDGRIRMARQIGADLLISLHADALEADEAQGASVYTLSQGDAASARMVERHERTELLAGVDLTGQGDRVATTLMSLARQKSGPEGDAFAALLVEQMKNRGVDLNSRPLRSGRLAVLSAADFPSVLIEAGFLSNAEDRSRLADPSGRAPLVKAIADAVRIWALEN